MRVDSIGPWAVIGCLTFGLGCGPDRGNPISGKPGPKTGGQTGDPGAPAPEHVSGVPTSPQSGSCERTPMTDTPRSPALRWPAYGGGPVLALETTPGDPGEIVVADLTFGVRVIDASEPDTLRAGAGLELEDPPLHLHRLDDARVLVVTQDEVLLVSLASDAPSVLARAELAGVPRSSHLVARPGGPWLHVVVDSYLEGDDVSKDCPPDLGTFIARHAVRGDRLEPLGDIDLGEGVQAVRFEEDRALVVSGEGKRGPTLVPSGVQWVSLAQDEPSLGSRTELPGAVARASDMRWTGTVLEILVLHPGEARAELVRFDASDPEAMAPLPGCELPLAGSREPPSSDFELSLHSHRSLFAPAGLVVRDGVDGRDAEPTTGRIVRLADTACEVQELELPANAELLLGPPGTLLAVGGARNAPFGIDDGALDVALFDSSASIATPSATASVPIDGSDRVTRFWPWQAALLEDAVRFGGDAAAETALLLVPKTTTQRDHYAETVAMVSVGSSTLTARGELETAFAPLRVGDRLYAAGHDRLSSFELDGSALPAALATTVLWPIAAQAWLASDGIVQARANAGDPWAEAPEVRLELVTGDDPATREVLGGVAVAGESRLFRVADMIVALELSDEWGTGAPRTLRVFDVAGAEEPREVGRLEDDALRADWDLNTDPPSTDWSWAATDDALVVRSARNVDDDRFGHTVFDFQVIDLRDPSAPDLHDITMPDEHHSAHALFSGTAVYYTHAVTTEDSSEARPEVRYFLQTIDLSDPGAPEVSEQVNVPGEVIAADGEVLYVRDATWEGDDLQYFVRRVELGEDRARITASVETGTRPIDARLTDAGDLAVTLFALPCRYSQCPEGNSTLLLLAPGNLEVQGEVELDRRCRIAGQVADTLVIEAPHRNVQLVDIAELSSPQVVRIFTSTKLADVRGGELLYVRGNVPSVEGTAGALFRVDLVPN